MQVFFCYPLGRIFFRAARKETRSPSARGLAALTAPRLVNGRVRGNDFFPSLAQGHLRDPSLGALPVRCGPLGLRAPLKGRGAHPAAERASPGFPPQSGHPSSLALPGRHGARAWALRGPQTDPSARPGGPIPHSPFVRLSGR
ncbi:hypothetical protein H1C71_021295 [Ictidomys tridecemlineatus]|nr:hypothetical protein H1C71_021295 [Ictidomys tridecemlineatus]